jgi:hypothetical protein
MNSHLDSQITLSEAPPLEVHNRVVDVEPKYGNDGHVNAPSATVYLSGWRLHIVTLGYAVSNFYLRSIQLTDV